MKNKLLQMVDDPTWAKIFESFFNTDKGKIFLDNFLPVITTSGDVFPDFKNLFRAFNLTPFNEVKVIVLGTKPFTNDAASGLAYGLSDDHNMYKALPSSLTCIENSLFSNIKKKKRFLFDDSMETWAAQGVLMLNASLTSSKSIDHSALWGFFIANVLQSLDNKDMVYWGIGEYPCKMITNFVKEGIMFKSFDPAYMGTSWKCDVYNQINVNLKKQIEWY